MFATEMITLDEQTFHIQAENYHCHYDNDYNEDTCYGRNNIC